MKKVFKIALFAGVTAMVAACTKDNSADVAQSQSYRTTNITIEGFAGDAASRTSMDTENKRLVWSETESAIAAIELAEDEFDGVNLDNGRVGKGECAEVVDGKATFNATVKDAREGEYTRGYLAVYPYESFNSLNGTTLEVTMPAEQTPAAVNDIDAAATLLFASDLEGYTETPANLALRFKHIAAYSSIRIKNLALNEGEGIAEIVITSNEEDKPLAGAWGFDFTSDKLAGDFGEETSQSITLDVSALDLEDAKTAEGVNVFFGALPCGELHDLTVAVTTTEGREFEKVITGANLTFENAYVEPFSVNFDGIKDATPIVTISFPATDDYGFMPVANGEIPHLNNIAGVSFDTATAFPNLPEYVTTEMVISIDKPAKKDLTIDILMYNDLKGSKFVDDDPNNYVTDNYKENDYLITKIAEGETSTSVRVTFPRSSVEGDCSEFFDVYCTDVPEATSKRLWVAKNYAIDYRNMSVDMFNNGFDYADNTSVSDVTEKGYGTLGMIDGNPDTFMRSEGKDGSKFGSTDWYKTGYYYGPFFDVTFPTDVAVVAVRYQNSTDYIPRQIAYGTQSGAEQLPSTPLQYEPANTNQGDWNTVTTFSSAIDVFRFGVRMAKNNDDNNVKALYQNSAWGAINTYALAEFQLMVMY